MFLSINILYRLLKCWIRNVNSFVYLAYLHVLVRGRGKRHIFCTPDSCTFIILLYKYRAICSSKNYKIKGSWYPKRKKKKKERKLRSQIWLWVPVSSTGKVFDNWFKLNKRFEVQSLTLLNTKNRSVSWSDNK